MNAFEDFKRRMEVITDKVLDAGGDPLLYTLVLGRQLYVDVADSMPQELRDAHHREGHRFCGWPLALTDVPGRFLALQHTVQG